MSKNIVVIGSGGREHALCWKLSQCEEIINIYAAPGNVGISKVDKVTNVNIDLKNNKAIVEWCRNHDVSLVIVGPEDPLANGVADALADEGILCFGPKKDAARLESDKDWAKGFMDRHNIPTAKWESFKTATEAKKFIEQASFPALVVKASGLAAGKGVVVAADKQEACNAVDDMLTHKKFGNAGSTVVVEELLDGDEVSCLAFTDGLTVKLMLPAQDHKRRLEGDKGSNTGGMGAYCPCPLLTPALQQLVIHDILQKTVDGLRKEKVTFVGVLYAGLMLTKDGPKVLEFNARFGDPETQVILPLLNSNLYQVMISCCRGNLHEFELDWKQNVYTVGVVMASKGYPETSTKGCVITGVDKVHSPPDQLVFHSGTNLNDKKELVTNGGRVLIAVASSMHLHTAVAKANKAVEIIKFDGAQYRKDIGFKGIARSLLNHGPMTYKISGVDITAGETLVTRIKPASRETTRAGCMGALGGFGGLFDPKAAGYKDPLLVSGTDGVGTKLKVAQDCNIHSSVGIDLVAMCVNDVLANGAEPLFFLDYFACGQLEVSQAADVVKGVAEGCKLAGCALIGGETAEMPGLYAPGDYDLAGFTVGAVERENLLPRTDKVIPSDVVIGLPSSGVHSNGFSLVRKVMDKNGFQYSQPAPFSNTNKTIGEELLTPTKIYSKGLLPALRSGRVKALAHITGGGLLENIPRILPPAVKVRLDANMWDIQPVFSWLAAFGGINDYELLRTFNCGLGIILIVSQEDAPVVMELLQGQDAVEVGQVETLSGTTERVVVDNFVTKMDQEMRRYVPSLISTASQYKQRVAVLISGSGTNLQALIDASTNPNKNCSFEIVLVLSNKAKVQGLERARQQNIPSKVLNHTKFSSRVEFDMAMDQILQQYNADLVCLAGFMRILSEEFVLKWRGRLVNIHPALLPSFKGTHAQKQALDAGVKIAGCTVHFVEPDIDAGAIIVQETVTIDEEETEESLIEKIKTVEHKAYPLGMELVASGRIKLNKEGKIEYKKI